jgi:DeoR/GlpR family transcriptional regulator of sugar metabolism
MAVRATQAMERKQALAIAGARLVTAGEVIFLDSGSANLALADALPDDLGLTIVTNSVPIAAALMARPGLDLIVLGGAVNRAVGGVVDASAVLAVQQLSIDRCFLGACALSARHGACAFDAGDAAFKRALVQASEKLVLLAVTEKLGTRAPHRVAPLEAFEALVLEDDAPEALVAELGQAGARIVIA